MTTLNTIIEEEKFIDAVWDVLKSGSNDLRKQQAILNLYRQSTTTAMQRAYEAGREDALQDKK